jgi:cytochrome P450
VSVVFDPFRPEHRRDPYPHYHEVRAADPVQRHPLLPVWVLTRYADVLAVLRDPRFSVDRTKSNLFQSPQSPLNRMGEGFRRAFLSMMLFRNPPDHTRLRHLVNKVFTPRMIESLRPRIQHIVDDLLTALARAEEEGDRLSADELFAMCVLILVAGHETTANLIGNAVLALLRNPDERRRLVEDPHLIRSAVVDMSRIMPLA